MKTVLLLLIGFFVSSHVVSLNAAASPQQEVAAVSGNSSPEAIKNAILSAYEKGMFGVLSGTKRYYTTTTTTTSASGATYNNSHTSCRYELDNPSQDGRDDAMITALANDCAAATCSAKEKQLLWSLLLTCCMQRKARYTVADGRVVERTISPLSIHNALHPWSKELILSTIIYLSLSIIACRKKVRSEPAIVGLAALGGLVGVPLLYFLCVLARKYLGPESEDVDVNGNKNVLAVMEKQLLSLITTFKAQIPAALATRKLEAVLAAPPITVPEYSKNETREEWDARFNALKKAQQQSSEKLEALTAFFKKVSATSSSMKKS